ncbi:MAG: hypothetical protein KIS66_13635 [Fimbriimonadaceae bacterium]|nr:hypothetical protein [Fimbriimonadaceae bacterium]
MAYVYPPNGWESPSSPELDVKLRAATIVADAEFSFNCSDWPNRRGTRDWREAAEALISARTHNPGFTGREFDTSYTHPFDEVGREMESWALFFAPDELGETIECHMTLASRSCPRRDVRECFEPGWVTE